MHTVTITCYDAQSNALQTKSVSNVTFQANTKTILAGNLFGSSNQSEINVTTAWGSTNTVGF